MSVNQFEKNVFAFSPPGQFSFNWKLSQFFLQIIKNIFKEVNNLMKTSQTKWTNPKERNKKSIGELSI